MISYKELKNSSVEDNFSKVIKESQDVFSQKHGLNIVGTDFESIVTTPSLYEDYVSSLIEGFDADTTEELQSLSESLRETILTESISGIKPYASLSMPMLIKLWARLGMKNAIPTEPVTQPAFTIPFLKPFIYSDDGITKNYLPESINVSRSDRLSGMISLSTTELTMTSGKVTGDAGKLLTTAEVSKGATLDRKFCITGIQYPKAETDTSATDADYKVTFEPVFIDTNNRLYKEVSASVGTTGKVSQITDTILGSVDLANGTCEIVTVKGTATKVFIKAYESTESHRKARNVGFDIDRRDIEIGTGQHLEASLPLEFLQDVKAMYNVDGAAQIVDLLSNISAQEVDLQISDFLIRSYDTATIKYEKTFNCNPSAQFAINPEDWLAGIRKVIDYVATDMRGDYKAYNGYFVIIGHPLDVNIIPDVNWSFTNANDDVNGIEVQYSLGALSSNNRYKIISSDLLNAGSLYMFFVPTQDNFKTYTYYPYTFNVVDSYLNTRTQNVPSIMLTKRQTIEEFTPIIGRIIIQNNDAMQYSHS